MGSVIIVKSISLFSSQLLLLLIISYTLLCLHAHLSTINLPINHKLNFFKLQLLDIQLIIIIINLLEFVVFLYDTITFGYYLFLVSQLIMHALL